MDIGDWLDRSAIAHRSSADGKRQALAAVAEIAARNFTRPGLAPLKGSEVFDALVEREAQGSTGVGRGVAVPHARLKGLDRMRAVFVRLDEPVAFDAVDDQPVDLLFALFAPEDASTEHLRALARVSRLLRSEEMRQLLRQARTADAIHAILRQDAEVTAA
jgi:PTS system nitrogen regulatory IIA component